MPASMKVNFNSNETNKNSNKLDFVPSIVTCDIAILMCSS